MRLGGGARISGLRRVALAGVALLVGTLAGAAPMLAAEGPPWDSTMFVGVEYVDGYITSAEIESGAIEFDMGLGVDVDEFILPVHLRMTNQGTQWGHSGYAGNWNAGDPMGYYVYGSWAFLEDDEGVVDCEAADGCLVGASGEGLGGQFLFQGAPDASFGGGSDVYWQMWYWRVTLDAGDIEEPEYEQVELANIAGSGYAALSSGWALSLSDTDRDLIKLLVLVTVTGLSVVAFFIAGLFIVMGLRRH